MKRLISIGASTILLSAVLVWLLPLRLRQREVTHGSSVVAWIRVPRAGLQLRTATVISLQLRILQMRRLFHPMALLGIRVGTYPVFLVSWEGSLAYGNNLFVVVAREFECDNVVR